MISEAHMYYQRSNIKQSLVVSEGAMYAR